MKNKRGYREERVDLCYVISCNKSELDSEK